MANMKVAVPHQLPQEEALRRIKGSVNHLKAQYSDKISNLQQEWNGNAGTFSVSVMGFPVSGSVNVTPSEVIIETTLPFAALPLKGKLESGLRERAARLLA